MKEINNNSLRIGDVGKQVTLYGWVQKKRDLGGVCFIDLRDRSGVVQLVAREGECYEIASQLKSESVIKVVGDVSERESKNKNIPTGDIEVQYCLLKNFGSSLSPHIKCSPKGDILIVCTKALTAFATVFTEESGYCSTMLFSNVLLSNN